MNWELMARYMYEQYAIDAKGKTWDLRDMPLWPDLTQAVQDHWVATAHGAWDFAMSPSIQEEYAASLIK